MSNLNIECWIDAKPERVFQVVTDIANLPEHVEAIQSVEVLTDGPVGVGTRFRETRIMLKREASEEMEFTSFDPPKAFTLEANSRGAKYITTYTIEPQNNGTLLSITFDATAASPVARVASALLMPFLKGAIRRAVEADLENFKHVAETNTE